MLASGRYVKIHSLQSDKAKRHNGKTAIVKSPIDDATGRCGVQPIGDSGTKVLAIKPTNLVLLCSCCKMKEAQTVQPNICERCHKESYCSQSCKKKHWEGANVGSNVPNCHRAWCIPIKLEMEVPTKAVGDSNVGEDIYEDIAKYLQLAADIGNSGRSNEERVMMEKLLEVDPHQPSAYYNLYQSCSQLAIIAERYHPDEFEELELKAVRYLTMGIDLILSHWKPGGNLDGPQEHKDILYRAIIDTINSNGLKFLEGCMGNQRGAGNPKLECVHVCLEKILALFEQQKEPTYKVHLRFGFCCQKLTKYLEAIGHFDNCCEQSPDRDLHRAAFVQIPLCLSWLAMYSDDKDPSERVQMMEGAMSNFKKALVLFKEEDPAMLYKCQAKLCRTLFNQNSMLNEFARAGAIEYTQEKREELYSAFNDMADETLRGATAAGDMSEIQSMRGLKDLPFAGLIQ